MGTLAQEVGTLQVDGVCRAPASEDGPGLGLGSATQLGSSDDVLAV